MTDQNQSPLIGGRESLDPFNQLVDELIGERNRIVLIDSDL